MIELRQSLPIVLILVAALRCSSDGEGANSAQGNIRCTGANPSFPSFDKTCTTESDCALVRHTTDCCGSQLIMAINGAEVPSFQSAESICSAQYPGCGCASQGPTAEDGTLVPFGSENLVVASCNNGKCQSRYGGTTFPCGTATCTDRDYCSVFSGGPAGSGSSYNCMPLGSCTSCSCVGATGCSCTENQGHITVSCAAP